MAAPARTMDMAVDPTSPDITRFAMKGIKAIEIARKILTSPRMSESTGPLRKPRKPPPPACVTWFTWIAVRSAQKVA
jgi:hypothetical protein